MIVLLLSSTLESVIKLFAPDVTLTMTQQPEENTLIPATEAFTTTVTNNFITDSRVDDNNNTIIDAANFAANYDGDSDGIADSQFSQIGQSCWACDAPNFEDCAKNGHVMKCSNSQEVCMLEVRKRGSRFTQVCMGCKDSNACENQRLINFQGQRPQHFQCKVGSNTDFEGPSVCRQCCYGPFCTGNENGDGKFWIPQTAQEWSDEKPGTEQWNPNFNPNANNGNNQNGNNLNENNQNGTNQNGNNQNGNNQNGNNQNGNNQTGNNQNGSNQNNQNNGNQDDSNQNSNNQNSVVYNGGGFRY